MKNLYQETIENAQEFSYHQHAEGKFHCYILKYSNEDMYALIKFPDGDFGVIPKSAYHGLKTVDFVRDDGIKVKKYIHDFDEGAVIKFTPDSPSTLLSSFNNKFYNERYGYEEYSKIKGD